MCCNLAVLSYFSFSVRHTHTLLFEHPPTVHSFAWLHTHTHTQWQAAQSRDNPNTDPVSPAQLSMCFRVEGSAPGGWESPLKDEISSNTHTHPIDIYRLPHTSALVVIGSCGRVDLTRQNMISRRRQEVCPGGQDASEIHFLTLPQHQHSLLPEPLLSSRKAAGWGSEGGGVRGQM